MPFNFIVYGGRLEKVIEFDQILLLAKKMLLRF